MHVRRRHLSSIQRRCGSARRTISYELARLDVWHSNAIVALLGVFFHYAVCRIKKILTPHLQCLRFIYTITLCMFRSFKGRNKFSLIFDFKLKLNCRFDSLQCSIGSCSLWKNYYSLVELLNGRKWNRNVNGFHTEDDAEWNLTPASNPACSGSESIP